MVLDQRAPIQKVWVKVNTGPSRAKLDAKTHAYA